MKTKVIVKFCVMMEVDHTDYEKLVKDAYAKLKDKEGNQKRIITEVLVILQEI